MPRSGRYVRELPAAKRACVRRPDFFPLAIPAGRNSRLSVDRPHHPNHRRSSNEIFTLAILACLAATPVAAQHREIGPVPQLDAVNPSMSLSSPTTNPLQEQMRQDYATELMGTQRELLQQNPSGLGRQEQSIGRELNNYTPR